MSQLKGKKVLVIEDSPTQAQLIELVLREEGLSVLTAPSGREGFKQFSSENPDLVILDIILPDLDGFTVCRRLKQKMGSRYVPILMLTSRDETEDRVDGLDTGADDYMVKPFKPPEFLARIRSLLRIKRLQDELQELLDKERESLKILKRVALVDHLTDVYNRHYFAEVLASEFEKAQRYRNELSCIMVDVDHFKEFNNRYGHDIGDWVLSETAGILKASLRHADVLARYGGDEFVILQPMTNRDNALHTADRLRKAVADKEWESNVGKLDISISLGVASLSCYPCKTGEDLLKCADQALFQGKQQGRNCACCYSSDNDA